MEALRLQPRGFLRSGFFMVVLHGKRKTVFLPL
jgi:hypothetical protein